MSVLTEAEGVLRAGDLPLPANVTLLTDPEEVVARIEAPRAAVGEEGTGVPEAEGESDSGGEPQAGR